jgi:hypothetical protein
MKTVENLDDLIAAFDKNQDAVLCGQFDTQIPEKFKANYCGRITNITTKPGKEIKVQPIWVFAKFKKYLQEGACEFKCSTDVADLSKTHFFRPRILSIKNIVNKEIPPEDATEVSKLKRNLKLKNNLFIGQFTQNKDGKSYTIRDIRRSDFSKLILQNKKEQQPILFHPKNRQFESGKYYEFTWLFNGQKENYVYLFKVDDSQPINRVTAHDVIDRIQDCMMNYSADAGQKIVKLLDTLKDQLTASGKEIFIYELLQNANDYPNLVAGKKERVDVEFHITQESLVFMHSGAVFNERNIAAICSTNDNEKTENKETIGYKGIGFKTVFLDNNYVYLQTGDFSFRFDKEENKDTVDTPWQILPIWTDEKSLTNTERKIFKKADNKFRVKFSLRPIEPQILRDASLNYVKMFQNVFQNERVILFIPNLASVKVFYDGQDTPAIVRRRENDSWQVDSFDATLPSEVTEAINDAIEVQDKTGSLKIPTKYKDFSRTRVSFACEINGNQLKNVEQANVYCYLPTDAAWGFKFLMNTDMIPKGDRKDIERFPDQFDVNAEISEIAGQKFYEWIKTLHLKGQYTACSIYDLIPDFETCVREHGVYQMLIERFQIGFETQLKDGEFIPISKDKFERLTLVALDETGLSSSGIMSDEELLKFLGTNLQLPLQELRDHAEFQTFQRRYLNAWNATSNIWNQDTLKKLCSKPEFQEWLKVQKNNNKFLDFLLEHESLSDFLGLDIFLGADGKLYSTSKLYYDIDKYLEDLQAFSKYLPHVSSETKCYFEKNEKWTTITGGAFKVFEPNAFVNNELLTKDNEIDTKELLKEVSTSIHFYKFLSEHVTFVTSYKSLPFLDENGGVVSDFNRDLIFFPSVAGNITCDAPWMTGVSTRFLSHEYNETTVAYFKKHFGVREFSDEIIVKNVVLSDKYRVEIQKAINFNFEVSKAFVIYCYAHKDSISANELSQYCLKGYDKNKHEQWYCPKGNVFFPSSCFDSCKAKIWILSDWMIALDNDYYGSDNSIKDFIAHAFGILEMTDAIFYNKIVQLHLNDIIALTQGEQDSDGKKSVDFVRYLDLNYKLIFENKQLDETFKLLTLKSLNLQDIQVGSNVYMYDKELAVILAQSWFPKELITLCSPQYGNSPALQAIGCHSYGFGNFFDEVIVPQLKAINLCVTTKEVSIAFHNFVIGHSDELSPNQRKKINQAKVWLYGNDVPSETASGHNILTDSAKKVVALGVSDFKDLDIIDPDYKPEDHIEYWRNDLQNRQFTSSSFLRWINDNSEIVATKIKEKEANLKFWRWVKMAVSVNQNNVAELPTLPVLLSDGTTTMPSCGAAIYFSDSYLEGAKIAEFILRFDKDAKFLSDDYMSAAENDIASWKSFWIRTGIKYKIAEILINTVIPKLGTIEYDGLVRLLADNRQELISCYKEQFNETLQTLRVQGADEKFYDLKDVLYIDCKEDEPFPYIELPNQISFDTENECQLIKDLLQYISAKEEEAKKQNPNVKVRNRIITSMSEWRQLKVDMYIALQTNNQNKIQEIHYQFINDLAASINQKEDGAKGIKRLEMIQLLNRQEQFCSACSLTMGSVYKPFFDFEKCGVKLAYVHDGYSEQCEASTGDLFRSMKVHCDFCETDIAYLTDRVCAMYFWGEYLLQKDASQRIQQMISNHKFDTVVCIPTKDGVKRPDELYFGKEIASYVRKIQDWENKVPSTQLAEIKVSESQSLFDLLPFKKNLDFLDALCALFSFAFKDKRIQLLKWIIAGYAPKYAANVNEYREDEHALWRNNHNKEIQIKQLYALEEGNKMLEQVFGTNPRIVNREYFPSGASFRRACDILGIPTISQNDLKRVHVGESIDQSLDTDLRIYALVIAGKTDVINWQKLYAAYGQKLDLLTLYKCQSIEITYSENQEIRQSLRKYYHEKGTNNFYFVESLFGRLFYLFLDDFIEFLGINTNEISKEVLSDIMESSQHAIELVKEHNQLMLDETFKNELVKLMPNVRCELIGNEVIDSDDSSELSYRPSYTTAPSDDANEEVVGNPSEETQYAGSTEPQTNSHTTAIPGIVIEHHDNQQNNVGYPCSIQNDRSIDRNATMSTEPMISQSSNLSASLNRQNMSQQPQPFSPEAVPNFGSHGEPWQLNVLDPTDSEKNALKHILGASLTPAQIASQNYLVRLRLYHNLQENGYRPTANEHDFVSNDSAQHDYALEGGKYIHACSADGGIMYLSPAIWNKLADGRCIVCVYYGAKANEFLFFNSQAELLKKIGKDDILIKVTGGDKAKVVNSLYSGVLKDVTGTAYTLIRVKSNEKYTPIFEALSNPLGEENVDIDEC